jgi:hypothetical protein
MNTRTSSIAATSSSQFRLQTHDGRLRLKLRRVSEGVIVERAQVIGAPEITTCWALLRSHAEFLACANRDRLRFDDPLVFNQLHRELQHAFALPDPDIGPPASAGKPTERPPPAQRSGAARDPGGTRRFRPLRPAGRFVPSHPGLWGARKRLRSRRA